jgi:hypothetical protein
MVGAHPCALPCPPTSNLTRTASTLLVTLNALPRSIIGAYPSDRPGRQNLLSGFLILVREG